MLTTARVLLRPLHDGDAGALCAYRSLPEVARYQSWDSFGPDDAQRLIDSQHTALPGVAGTWFQLAIVESATKSLIGDCGLHGLPPDGRQMEFGITLSPSHQRHGYATEVITALLEYVFGHLPIHRVTAVVDADNPRAAALFRRLGFRQEAHFVEHLWYKGSWGSELVFALLKREWETRG